MRAILWSMLMAATMSSLCTGAAAQRDIPDDNLGYPVLINLSNGGGSGSGFFINAKNFTYLVTAKHVLFNPANQLIAPHMDLVSYSPDPKDATPNLISADLGTLIAAGNVKYHQTADVAVVRLFKHVLQDGKNLAAPVPGVASRGSSRDGITGADLETLATFENVLVGNEIIVFGYPSSLALAQVGQLDPNRPLLRKGMVAGTNPTKRSLVLDCPVYFGNSGGPVLEIIHKGFTTELKIIGVVDQYVPFIQAGGGQTFAMQIASNSGVTFSGSTATLSHTPITFEAFVEDGKKLRKVGSSPEFSLSTVTITLNYTPLSGGHYVASYWY
jgi:Trypsin-like peptidase domain